MAETSTSIKTEVGISEIRLRNLTPEVYSETNVGDERVTSFKKRRLERESSDCLNAKGESQMESKEKFVNSLPSLPIIDEQTNCPDSAPVHSIKEEVIEQSVKERMNSTSSEVIRAANTGLIPDEDDPNFYCCVCKKKSTVRSSFRSHLMNVHKMTLKPRPKVLQKNLIERFSNVQPDENDPDFNCCVCQKTYSDKYNYRRHLRMCHKMNLKPLGSVLVKYPTLLPDEDDPNNHCCACEKKFNEKYGYRSHLEVVHGMKLKPRERTIIDSSGILPDEDDPNGYCRVCDKTLESMRSYRNHLRSIHWMTLKPTQNARRIANIDIQPDENDPNNYCRACDKTLAHKESFGYHLRYIHGMTIPDGLKTTSQIVDNAGGGDNVTGFDCNAYESSSADKATLDSHACTTEDMQAVLSQPFAATNLVPDENDPNFYCLVCSKNSSNRRTYYSHLRLVHHMEVSSDTPPPSESADKPIIMPNVHDPYFYCCLCNRTLSNRDTFHRHLRTKHKMKFNLPRPTHQVIPHPEVVPDEDDPNFYCGACEKTFSYKTSFRHHLVAIHKLTLMPRPEKVHYRICNPDLIPDEDDPNSFCRACEKTYCNRKGYLDHLVSVHEMTLKSRTANKAHRHCPATNPTNNLGFENVITTTAVEDS